MTQPLIAYVGAPEGFEALREAANLKARTTHVAAEPAAVAAALATAAGYLDASMRVPLTPEVLAKAPNLRIVSCATTGSDHISRPAAEERNIAIRITEMPDADSYDVAGRGEPAAHDHRSPVGMPEDALGQHRVTVDHHPADLELQEIGRAHV